MLFHRSIITISNPFSWHFLNQKTVSVKSFELLNTCLSKVDAYKIYTGKSWTVLQS